MMMMMIVAIVATVAFLGTLTLLCKRQQAPAGPSSSPEVVYVCQPPSTGRAVENSVYAKLGERSTDGRSATGYIERSNGVGNTAGYLDVG